MAYVWNPSGKFYIGITSDTRPDYTDIGAILHEIDLVNGIRRTYQTHDRGSTWTEISNGLLTPNTEGTLHAIAPTKANTVGGVYMATPPTYNDGDLTVLRTNVNGDQVVQLAGSNVEQDGSLKTTMTTVLDSDYDSINVDKMGKGGVVTVHSAIADTATSDEVDCRGYNAILVEAGVFSAAENWTFKVQGCMVSGGTFVDWYEQANTGVMTLMSYQCNAARGFIFKGIPDYVKIVATRDGGASAVTVKAQPLNV